MKQALYSIRDAKVGTFSPPFPASNKEHAHRLVSDSVTPESMLFNHSADFACYQVGEWHTESGTLLLPEDGQPIYLFGLDAIVSEMTKRPWPQDPSVAAALATPEAKDKIERIANGHFHAVGDDEPVQPGAPADSSAEPVPEV